MKRHLLIAVIFLAELSSPVALQADDAAVRQTRDQDSLTLVARIVDRYCVACHDGAEPAAGLNLREFDTRVVRDTEQWNTETWEKIVKRMAARQMPPPDVERPSESEYATVLTAMEAALDQHTEKYPQPGRTDSVRRLNRTEYQNAIRDLLAVDVDVDSLLPADQLSHGFDNVTVGELSPLLLGRYITAAEKISRQAVGGLEKSPGGLTVRLPADRTQDVHVDGLPLGTRGGTLFEHHFPANGQYEIQLRLMRDRDENIEGLTEPHDIDVLLDRGLVHRFTVTPPKGKAGYQKDDTLVDAHLRKRFRVTAGPHKVGVTFPSRSASLLEINRQPFEASFNRHRHPRRAPALFEVSIVGPFDPEGPGDTPSRRKIFSPDSVQHGEDQVPTTRAEKTLRPLVSLAYRRPVTENDLAIPMRFFRQRFATDGFDAGIETALSSVLVNPHFLLRAEKDPEGLPPGSIYRISDIELASRLSFFLWSSIPDEELLTLAAADQLQDADVLKSQVQRMLKDQRSRSLVNNFAAQWLYLRNLDSFQPDRRLFPDFDDNLRIALRRETELLFESVLRSGPAPNGLDFSQRTPGQALRNFSRVRQPFPSGDSSPGQPSRWPAPAWQHSRGDVLRHQNVADNPGQLDSRKHSRHAGSSASAECAEPEGRNGILSGHHPRASGRASTESRLRQLPQSDGSCRLRAGKFRRRWPLAIV